MTIPKQVKIGGHLYKILITKDPTLLEGALALIDEHLGMIYIDGASPQSVRESALIHEIFHALNGTLGDSELGHALIESLSEQFYQVLSDNHLLR